VTFESIGLGGATGRGAEPSAAQRPAGEAAVDEILRPHSKISVSHRQVRAFRLVEQAVELVADAGAVIAPAWRRADQSVLRLASLRAPSEAPCDRGFVLGKRTQQRRLWRRPRHRRCRDLPSADHVIAPGIPSRWAESTIRSRRPSDCSWTATSRTPWRMCTLPAATVTATRSPIRRYDTE
jgi:hypothetical protein